MSICVGTPRWTVSHRDSRGIVDIWRLWGGRLASAVSPEAPVEQMDQVQLHSGSSGRESEQEQLSGEGAESGSGCVEPFPPQGPRGSGILSQPRARVDPGCGAGTPEERGVTPPSAGATAELAQRAAAPSDSQTGMLYSQNKARTTELMPDRQQTQSRSETPGGR